MFSCEPIRKHYIRFTDVSVEICNTISLGSRTVDMVTMMSHTGCVTACPALPACPAVCPRVT